LKDLLIEKWFPVNEASIESSRERSFAYLPPLHILHIWWARRPLTVSRIAAVLAALPADSYTKDEYDDLLYDMGLRGDPVKAAEERKQGKRSFGYPVFESVNPDPSFYMEKAKKLWGRLPTGADLMAGGGSIPFEMARAGYGEIVAGELNPVAYIVLKAGLDYPAKYRDRIVKDVDKYGKMVLSKVREKLRRFYPSHPAGQPMNYIWVKMFKCPTCGCEIPALKTLWLDRKKNVAFYPMVEEGKVDLKLVNVREIKKIK